MRIRFSSPNRTRSSLFGSGIGSISDPRICLAMEMTRSCEMTFREFKIQLKDRYEELKIEAPDFAPLDKAFDLASIAHKDTPSRANGQPYISHPLDVAFEMLKVDWLEVPALCAALLHDAVEETAEKPQGEMVTIKRIRQELGDEVADLVNGLTKLRKIGLNKEMRDVRNLKKWIDFISRDVRVGMLKLFDRLCNSRTFHELSEDRAYKNAMETMDIYVPVAHGLGMGKIRAELEENSLQIIYPQEYKQVRALMNEEAERASENLTRLHQELFEKYMSWGAQVFYEAEPLPNVLRRFRMDPMISMRDTLHNYILEVPEDICYDFLGMLHRPDAFRYVQHSLEDFISNPTSSRYRALHTVVLIPGVGNVTFKIMSPEMRRLADVGPLESYKPGNPEWYRSFQKQYQWIEDIAAYLRTHKNTSEAEIRAMTQSSVFSFEVFTSKMESINIPAGSTSLDFAYRIHSEIGRTASYAKITRGKKIFVDHEMSYPLRAFDRVEIVTEEGKVPVLQDLDRVRTSHARSQIIAFLKNQPRLVSEGIGRQFLGLELERAKAEAAPFKSYLQPEDLAKKHEVRGVEKYVFEAFFSRLNSDVAKEHPIKRPEDLFYQIGIGQMSYEKVVKELLEFLHERRHRPRRPHILQVSFDTTDRPGILAGIARPIADLHLNIIDVRTTYLSKGLSGKTTSAKSAASNIAPGKIARLTVRIRTYNDIQRIQLENILAKAGRIQDIREMAFATGLKTSD